jgi:hypothetical protein
MKLPHIRQTAPIGQMSKPPPSVLLGKQLTKQIAVLLGVSSSNSVTRNSCAELQPLRRPAPLCRGSNVLIKSSGMNRVSKSSKPAVPVVGNGIPLVVAEMHRTENHHNRTCSFCRRNHQPYNHLRRIS